MPRSREFDPDEVLQIAVDLFWEKGYFDASVDELVRRSGVAKYGIYGTLGGKRELFRKVLDRYAADRRRDIQKPVRKKGAALPEIRRFFRDAARMATAEDAPRGCLMLNSGVELGKRNPEVGETVRAFFDDLRQTLEGCVGRAIDRQQLAAATDAAALAAYLVTEFRTLLMLAASGHTRREIQAHLRFALRALD